MTSKLWKQRAVCLKANCAKDEPLVQYTRLLDSEKHFGIGTSNRKRISLFLYVLDAIIAISLIV